MMSKGTAHALRTATASRRALDPVELYAKVLYASILAELPEAESLTRDDLLGLRALSHVATITRYKYTAEAVQLLIRQGKLLPKSRTVLVLRGRSAAYDNANELPLWRRYESKIRRLVGEQHGGKLFIAMDIVDAWSGADQHLTRNSKRVAVRECLRHMVREGELQLVDGYNFRNRV